MALDMLSAGVDTTSNTMSFLLYALALNPEKQAILREEIRGILPDKSSPMTEQAMRNLPYLRACMKEAARMRATLVGTARRLPVDTVLCGYQMPKFTDISMSTMMMSMEEKNFKRANEFIPERFLKGEQGEHELKAQNPFSFLPFGFGARMCIGKRLAELEIEILTAKLVRNFEIQWPHKKLGVKNEMVNSLNGPLKFKMVDV